MNFILKTAVNVYRMYEGSVLYSQHQNTNILIIKIMILLFMFSYPLYHSILYYNICSRSGWSNILNIVSHMGTTSKVGRPHTLVSSCKIIQYKGKWHVKKLKFEAWNSGTDILDGCNKAVSEQISYTMKNFITARVYTRIVKPVVNVVIISKHIELIF